MSDDQDIQNLPGVTGGDDDHSSGGEMPMKTSGGGDDDGEAKRRKRLEMNRKAARESRRRKKLRIEELQRSVVFLTRENNELREQNELLRQMLAAQIPSDGSALDRFQAENAAALNQSLLGGSDGGLGLLSQFQRNPNLFTQQLGINPAALLMRPEGGASAEQLLAAATAGNQAAGYLNLAQLAGGHPMQGLVQQGNESQEGRPLQNDNV